MSELHAGLPSEAAERYQVERELARGGMGRVLAARDSVLERRVALKTLLDPRPDTVARLVEEAQLTGQLGHPGIVPLHELGGSGRDVFLVMKLVEGRSLKELVDALAAGDARTCQRYGVRSLLRLFLEVCEAVAFAHDRGVVHRDLKPANVMVGPSDEVLVLDWGVAKPIADAGGEQGAGSTIAESVDAGPRATVRSTVRELAAARATAARSGARDDGARDTGGDLTQADGVVGTPAYMAPEQAGGDERLDRRADVYALGATLYELLTLRPPFSGGAMEVVMKVLAEPPPRPRAVAPTIPPALEAIVLRAMARSREARYPDARALARDLERWLDDLPVEAYQETSREAVTRLVSRHRIPAITALVALGVLLAGGLAARATVKREQARLEQETVAAAAAVHDAEEAAQVAAQAAATSLRAARALDAVTPAQALLEGFARATDSVLSLDSASGPTLGLGDPEVTVVPVEAGASAEANVHRLSQAHAEARAGLDAVTADLVALQTGPDDPAVRPCLEEVQAARAVLDRELLEAYLGRAPEAALAATASGDLRPGAAWSQVARVRALRRLARATSAAEEAARLPDDGGGDPVCAAAVRALRAVVLDRPAPAREKLLDEALKLDPGAGWLYVQRAEARAAQGRFDAARDDYDQATRIRRLDAWAHTSRLVHTYMPSYLENMQADPAAFAEYLAPSNVEGRLFVGRCLQWQFGSAKDWKALERTWAKLARDDPAGAERSRADVALLVDRRDVAEEAARAVLARHADDRVGLAVLAEVQRRNGALDEAAATAEAGLRSHPADPALQRVRGRVALDQGQARQALPWLADGTPSSLDSSDWALLALAYARSSSADDWEKGVAAARRGLSLDANDMFYYFEKATPVPGDPRLHRALGQLRLKQGKPAAAAVHFARAYFFAVFTNLPKKHLGRVDRQDALACGEAHEKLGLPNEAAAWYAQATGDPTVAEEAQRRLGRLGGR